MAMRYAGYADSIDALKAAPTSAITKVMEEVAAGAVVLVCYDNEWVLWWSALSYSPQLPEPEDRIKLDHAFQVAKAFIQTSPYTSRVHVSVNDRGQCTSIGRSEAPCPQIMLGYSDDQTLRAWAKNRLGKEAEERDFA